MKKSFVTIIVIIAGFFAGTVLVTSCNSKKTEQQEQKEEEGNESMEGEDHDKMDSTATVYACTMHPEVTGKEGDKCSKCGMKLEAVMVTDSTATHKDHAH